MKSETKFWIVVILLILGILGALVGMARAELEKLSGEQLDPRRPVWAEDLNGLEKCIAQKGEKIQPSYDDRAITIVTEGRPLRGIKVKGAKLLGWRIHLKEKIYIDVCSFSYEDNRQRIVAYRLDNGRQVEFPCIENVLYIQELRTDEGEIARFVFDNPH